jgi:hypothetical protein
VPPQQRTSNSLDTTIGSTVLGEYCMLSSTTSGERAARKNDQDVTHRPRTTPPRVEMKQHQHGSYSRQRHPDSYTKQRHPDSYTKQRHPNSYSKQHQPDSYPKQRRPDSYSRQRHPNSYSKPSSRLKRMPLTFGPATSSHPCNKSWQLHALTPQSHYSSSTSQSKPQIRTSSY